MNMEFLSNVTLIINPLNFDPKSLQRIKGSLKIRSDGRCLRLTGTFPEIQNLVDQLQTAQNHQRQTHLEDFRGQPDQQDHKDLQDQQDYKNQRDHKEQWGQQDHENHKDQWSQRISKDHKDQWGQQGHKDHKDQRGQQDHKDHKDQRGQQDHKDHKDQWSPQYHKYQRHQQHCRDYRDHLDQRGHLDHQSQRDQLGSVSSISVISSVLTYILKKKAHRVERILGDDVNMDWDQGPGSGLALGHRPGHGDPSSQVTVTFRPRRQASSSATASALRCEYAARRFISFYQRTASDLQVHRAPLKLQTQFPQILFQSRSNDPFVMVTGPFAHIARLRRFLEGTAANQSKASAIKAPDAQPLVNNSSSNFKAPPPNRKSGSDLTALPPKGKSGFDNVDLPQNRKSNSEPEAPPPDSDGETCAICMDRIGGAGRTALRCGHSFCSDCLEQAFRYKPVCPTCGRLYGVLIGPQPEGGTMAVRTSSEPLPGHQNHGTITITYTIPSGVQTEEHPNPGRRFTGTRRTAFLPDSPEGRGILQLLQRAFNQRLVFTVGRSTSSGRDDVVTWNDIHHKTATHGGPTSFGFPDPDYLQRVRDELKVKGIE